MASTLFDLPAEIREQINEKIEQGMSIQRLQKFIKDNFSDTLSTPAFDTLSRYRKQYKVLSSPTPHIVPKEEIQRDFNAGLAELDKVLNQIKDKQDLDYSNVNVLQGLMGKCLIRLSELEKVQADNSHIDVNLEKQILAYIDETKNFVKTIVTLTNALNSQQAKLDELIQKETKFILQTVSNIVLQICPDRYDQFTAAFRSSLVMTGRGINEPEHTDKTTAI